MQTQFWTLVLALITALQAQAVWALNEDVSGTWYLKAIITDREIPGKKPEALTPLTIRALEGGNLEMKTTMMVDWKCQDAQLILEKDGEPGKFTAYGGKRHIYIHKTSLEDHYILYCEGELEGQQVRMAKLVGRGPDSNPQALKEFEKFAEDKGLNSEKVLIPKQLAAGTFPDAWQFREQGGCWQACTGPESEDLPFWLQVPCPPPVFNWAPQRGY
ncbi:lipocalin-1 [Rhynchocyon petersi]